MDNLAIHGISEMNSADLTRQLASAAGQAFADVNMANDRENVLTYYYARGFPNATFTATWQLGATPKHVNVVYTIKEGDRQFVREVITSGLKITRQSYVDKHITMKPGDPLSPIQETDIQKKFYDLGIFAQWTPPSRIRKATKPGQIRSLQFRRSRPVYLHRGYWRAGGALWDAEYDRSFLAGRERRDSARNSRST